MELEVENKFTYESVQQDTFKESNVYELCQVPPVEERPTTRRLGWEGRRAEQHKDKKKREQTTWNKPVIVLLLLIEILQVGILCLLLARVSTRDTGTYSGANSGLPDFNEWANGVVSKVNSNVTGSLPDFNEWANGVVSKVNSNVTGSLPDFNEWATGVVSKVNSNVTGSLPDFNEWANGVVSKVNSNVTGSLPDFNEWANGVISKVNSNVTGSLPDFDEWANSVVSKVNSNVTGSLPDFNEWANGVSQNTLQLFQNNTNFTDLDKKILQTTRDSAQKLINIVNTLSNLQDTSTSTAGVVDDILLIAQELLVLHNDSTALPTSCKKIKERQPLSPSGLYLLANTNDTYIAYCNMGTLCGSGGGWTRLAYLNMSDATQNCPSGFRLYQSGGVRACGRPVTYSSSCVSVQFPSNGISYSQICGRVTGYQYGSTDAVSEPVNNVNSYYLDGVSITRGSPRQHVWSLYAGVYSDYSNSININFVLVLVVLVHSLLLVTTTFVRLVLQALAYHKFSTHLIHSGMVKDVLA
uniref:Fibrinogen C-terminal domain-containing protein n=1 Tax=Amphimedon queenslandica TaxID=400682 RepID=A0A1X7UU89_AMPQE